jgi:hypothetical protein
LQDTALATGAISVADWLGFFRDQGVPGTSSDWGFAKARAQSEEPEQDRYLVYWFAEGGWDSYSMLSPVDTPNHSGLDIPGRHAAADAGVERPDLPADGLWQRRATTVGDDEWHPPRLPRQRRRATLQRHVRVVVVEGKHLSLRRPPRPALWHLPAAARRSS